jgi:putative membrane protein
MSLTRRQPFLTFKRCTISRVIFVRLLSRLLLLALFTLPASQVYAHSPLSSSGAEQISALLSTLLLLIFWGIYWRGLKRKPARRSLVITFNSACLLCAFAVLGPLDDWATTSSSAHMTQHMILMVVIAPLWVLSRPLPQLLSGGGVMLAGLFRFMLRLTRYPMMMAYLHGFIIWFWHLPYFYMLAVRNPWWHVFEHLCFLVTAGWFWWAVLNSQRKYSPFALLALLFTLMHTGFLGAFLTFARAPWYGEARSLADQQLAGLIMWVAGGIPYLLAAMWVGYQWYGHLQRRMAATEETNHSASGH